MKKGWKIIFWCVGALLFVYLIQFPNKEGVFIWSTVPFPVSGKTIVIDPGHGGRDGGAIARDNTSEKDIALAVAKQTQEFLEQAGAIVYLTRETDTDLAGESFSGSRKERDIRNRLKFIHEKEPDLFITIHLNSLPSPRWRGAQTFYHPSILESKLLAETIQKEIIRNLENTNRAPLEMNSMYLLKHAEVPGALVEIGFLSNDEERELLKDPTYQKQMAASIYQGILRYIVEKEEIEEES